MTDSTNDPGTAVGAASGWSIAPNFCVDDVVASAAFYRDLCGFHYDRLFGDPPAFCMVMRAGVTIMLRQVPGGARGRPNRTVDPEGEAWDAYVYVDDADALHAELAGKGVTIVRAPCDQPYGCRDFEIEDLDGFRLCFGSNL